MGTRSWLDMFGLRGCRGAGGSVADAGWPGGPINADVRRDALLETDGDIGLLRSRRGEVGRLLMSGAMLSLVVT